MNIRQAARWAQAKDCLYRTNQFAGDVEYMYATYNVENHEVACISWDYEKCKSAAAAMQYPRIEALDTIMQEIWESEGEQNMIPDACEVREWQ